MSDEGDEDSNGDLHRPRLDLDLDAGVIRLSNVRQSDTTVPPDAPTE